MKTSRSTNLNLSPRLISSIGMLVEKGSDQKRFRKSKRTPQYEYGTITQVDESVEVQRDHSSTGGSTA
jgi:hypothetical protein